MERRLLLASVRGMRPTEVRRFRILPPGASRLKFDSSELALEALPAGETVRPQWEMHMVAVAFSRRLAESDLGGRFVSVLGLGTDGQFASSHRVDGAALDTLQLGGSLAERKLSSTVVRAIQRTGADVEEVRVSSPFGLAYAAVIRVEDPADYLRHHLRPLLLRLPAPDRVDGRYFRIVDADGFRVLETGGAAGVGMY